MATEVVDAARKLDASATPPPGRTTFVGLALAVLVALVTAVLPAPEGLTPQATHLAGVFTIAIILWSTFNPTCVSARSTSRSQPPVGMIPTLIV